MERSDVQTSVGEGVGKRSAEACGWKPARAKTSALRVGLVYDSRPRPGARPNHGLSTRSLIKTITQSGLAMKAHGGGEWHTARSTLGSQMTCHPTAAGLGVGVFSYNHYLPARIVSNHVAPGRECRPISAKNIHCLGGGNFGRTAPVRYVLSLPWLYKCMIVNTMICCRGDISL